MLVVAALDVLIYELSLANELLVVRLDVVHVELSELGALEVFRELGGGAGDVLLVALTHRAAVRIRHCR